MVAAVVAVVSVSALAVGVPQQINYQARIEANGVPFDGVGQFKFAIVDQAGTNTYWSNDGTSVGGNAPSNAVALNVSGGLLNAMLGNASYPNMVPIAVPTFSRADAHVRMWFGGADGTTLERLSPDRPLGSVLGATRLAPTA